MCSRETQNPCHLANPVIHRHRLRHRYGICFPKNSWVFRFVPKMELWTYLIPQPGLPEVVLTFSNKECLQVFQQSGSPKWLDCSQFMSFVVLSFLSLSQSSDCIIWYGGPHANSFPGRLKWGSWGAAAPQQETNQTLWGCPNYARCTAIWLSSVVVRLNMIGEGGWNGS